MIHVRVKLLGLLVVGLVPMAYGFAEEGFVPLFDGKTLDGWTICCLP